ncbi:Pyrimidine pathway regulatory protein 1 [Colletotrichum fructicola Nara gc5]|uniref:Pyrimidine pathway regulatory protein 1 n=1 Tax=Colletotrichum fructicola (strain Nara gc5) TaxID=1213859 RepID=A0A7J6IX16_COLFN|nr:Pyrimidine pathway regulatory protein 1 [Colletotrichum fructicola Nara gc5]
MQKSHRRSTKVCTRCRQRKTKCDFKFPECTSCKLAGAPCLGFDPATRKPVPRSLVKSLEALVAELEAQVLASRAGHQQYPSLMASKIAQATISFGTPITGSYPLSKISPNLFMRPSCPPLAISANARGPDPELGSNQRTETHESPANREGTIHPANPYTSNLINLKNIPNWALDRMVRNYANTHLPQYPCISEALLENIVERAKDEAGQATGSPLTHGTSSLSETLDAFESFVLSIVLAISALTMTSKDEQQARSASESFYKSALKHLQAIGECRQIQALQISLLLSHYSSMCPERLDNWTCIANAVRIVLGLGLHREFSEEIDAGQARLRSELFWVTYGMERSLCTNLRLPLSFPEEIITTKLRAPSSDEASAYFKVDDMIKKSSANHLYRYRALETEVHRVFYLQEDIPALNGTTIGDWMLDISSRLETWLRTRLPEDWGIVLESCERLIEDYVSQERRGRLFYPWHGVHILFETAMIALHASWSSREYQPFRDQAEHMVQTLLPQCLQVLSNIGQRWGEATRCADKLRPLVQKVSSAFTWANQLSVHEAALIEDEIEGLIFSDKNLSWNAVTLENSGLGVEDGALLIDNMLVDDLNALQWAPDWDLVFSEIL